MEKRMNYPYAQIDENNIVTAVSSLWDIINESHPFYDVLIPIREYYLSLLGQRYIGKDDEGYGIFEPVEETEEVTENE